ncbi:DUF155-domain-containing protein [Jaminaea rosea]|uniref:DUF155-domain-containing protein n=1 Tax=Jaminaea rosea TaxID=1569628 RepID=A0A316UP86_9BASI|nr:DUF155-domain-containing protein [Jaminaea rosea]PWN27099.1 DUF155-domain-containing protein [Jaminaea rosea]
MPSSSSSSNSSSKRRDATALPASYSSRRSAPGARAGPQRTTKGSGKLKILPEEPQQSHSSTSQDHRPDSEESSDDDDDDDNEADASDRKAAREGREEVYKQLAQIPEGSMRRDARRLTRKGRASLPRVTAYSTATSYRMRELTRFLQARSDSHRTNVMTFDECVYTTYSYDVVDAARNGYPVSSTTSGATSNHPPSSRDRKHSSGGSGGGSGAKTGDLLGIPELNEDEAEQQQAEDGTKANAAENGNGTSSSTTLVETDADEARRLEHERLLRREEARRERRERFTVKGATPEVFFMEYGTVVIWGMTQSEERRLLREIKRFEVERLAPEDVESEELNWYLADYSRIYNDVITLRRGSSYMTKLSLSHALAQSTKISFFEGVIDNTIDTTKDIPQSIAESGKIGMPPAEIMKQIGHLFILRMNIHLVGSIVDSPEIFWAQPDLEPLYSAARSYLEIPQRIDLLNARVEVLQDMLQLLKDQVTSRHSESLEIIVIILIVLEIILGLLTMFVDLYFS